MMGERPRRALVAGRIALVAAVTACGRGGPGATIPLPASAETGIVAILGPTVIAFFPRPTAAAVADSATSRRLRTFRATLARVRSPFERAGVRVYEQYTDTLAVRDQDGVQIYVPAREEHGAGYYLAAPGRAPEILQGLRSDAELRDAVWRYFHGQGAGKSRAAVRSTEATSRRAAGRRPVAVPLEAARGPPSTVKDSMHPSVAPLAAIYDLNTDLLANCLDGLSEEEARGRLAGGGNSIAFLAAHLTDTRHFLTNRLGRPLPNPLTPYLADARSIDDIRRWPPLADIQEAWHASATHLAGVLDALTDNDLARPGVHRFPLADTTALGFLAFLAQHESYHVGQAAFLRRQLGKPAMAYTRRGQGTPTPAA